MCVSQALNESPRLCNVHAQLPSHVWLFATPWTAALQTDCSLSMGFPRQENWSGLPLPSPGDHPNSGTELSSPGGLADSLPLSHWWSPACTKEAVMGTDPHLAGRCMGCCLGIEPPEGAPSSSCRKADHVLASTFPASFEWKSPSLAAACCRGQMHRVEGA